MEGIYHESLMKLGQQRFARGLSRILKTLVGTKGHNVKFPVTKDLQGKGKIVRFNK